jgi:acyl carrier protein phosphodiesterase
MNFLAHIYLSGDDDELLIGNFIADAVKGKQFLNFKPEIARGILLHRFIDSYTDNNCIVGQSKTRLRNNFGKFAGIITDVFYDHFLANHWKKFSEDMFEDFIQQKYQILLENGKVFPESTLFMFEKMMEQNWLVNYKDIEGIDRALTGLSKRFPYPNKMNLATAQLQEDYHAFEQDFLTFFPVLIKNSESFLKNLSAKNLQEKSWPLV